MVLSFFVFLPSILYVFATVVSVKMKKKISTHVLAAVGTFVTGFVIWNFSFVNFIISLSFPGFFQLIAVLTFGFMYNNFFRSREELWQHELVAKLDWSFVITCLSSVTCFMTSFFLIFNLCTKDETKEFVRLHIFERTRDTDGQMLWMLLSLNKNLWFWVFIKKQYKYLRSLQFNKN